MLLDEVITKDEYTEKKNELENQIKKNNEQYEKLLAKSKNQVSAEDRLKEIEKFLSADFKSSDDIDDETVANIVDKIIVNDDTLDVYLKNGDKDFPIPIGNNKIKTLCVSETGQYRTHTENIYSQKIRRIKKRSSKSWLYFNVYL